jgi:hypothetical protein
MEMETPFILYLSITRGMNGHLQVVAEERASSVVEG